MACLNTNALIAAGKVLERNLEKLHVRTKEHWIGFHWEEFQAFRTFYLTCTCGCFPRGKGSGQWRSKQSSKLISNFSEEPLLAT